MSVNLFLAGVHVVCRRYMIMPFNHALLNDLCKCTLSGLSFELIDLYRKRRPEIIFLGEMESNGYFGKLIRRIIIAKIEN